MRDGWNEGERRGNVGMMVKEGGNEGKNRIGVRKGSAI